VLTLPLPIRIRALMCSSRHPWTIGPNEDAIKGQLAPCESFPHKILICTHLPISKASQCPETPRLDMNLCKEQLHWTAAAQPPVALRPSASRRGVR